MRAQVQYARALAAWLRHEAAHCESLEELGQDLAFAARRLGFESIKIKLGPRERSWGDGGECRQDRRFRHEFGGKLHGLLELDAPAGSNLEGFEVTADLLAEVWQSALSRLAEDHESCWTESVTGWLLLRSPGDTGFERQVEAPSHTLQNAHPAPNPAPVSEISSDALEIIRIHPATPHS
jgi:hypothetical protein